MQVSKIAKLIFKREARRAAQRKSYKLHRKAILDKKKKKYRANPEYRKSIKERNKKIAQTKEYKDYQKKYHSDKYANDPEYREIQREKARLWAAEKRKNDPEYREKQRLIQKEIRRKKKEGYNYRGNK